MISDKGPSLLDASRYVERHRDKVVVVKLGGELLDDGPVLDRLLPQVAVLYRCGIRPLLVHGGGRQVDVECASRGVTFRKIGGRRITSREVMDVLLDVVAGSLNQLIVRKLEALGVPARGHADGVSKAIRCTKRPAGRDPEGNPVDWGFVGDVHRIGNGPLRPPAGQWAIPVIPSLGTLDDGTHVNVNADSVASHLAIAGPAAKLVLMTSVPGILASPEAAGPISEVRPLGARSLIENGVIKGGMRAKVEEALRALDRGVPRVHIVSGREPMTLLREIFTDDGCGTLISAE